MEVVQRIGYDSFCPDNGVLLAKNKDSSRGNNGGPNGFNSFIWVIDAHPEDINVVDFVRPNGQKVMRTIADYRQVNDALFHAGLNSGSKSEWEDTANRLHFYMIDLHEDAKGILSYTLGVRSLDGSGPQVRGVALSAPAGSQAGAAQPHYDFTVRNTGKAQDTDPALHRTNANAWLNSDIYRLSVSVDGKGWSAQLLNEFVGVKAGGSQLVPVYLSHAAGATAAATVTFEATSESDPTKVASVAYKVAAR
jgi:hypothetical protein